MELEEVEEVVLTTSSTPHDVPPAEAGHLPACSASPLLPVLRIRIRRVLMFLGLLDPAPDPDPSITKQK